MNDIISLKLSIYSNFKDIFLTLKDINKHFLRNIIDRTKRNPMIVIKNPIKLANNWEYENYDPAHDHFLLYRNNQFFLLTLKSNFVLSTEQPKLLYHLPEYLSEIILAKVSLDEELIAIQTSLTTIKVFDLKSKKRWIIEIKTSNDNFIYSKGLIWSEHGGNSQDLIIVTAKGLELYKISISKGYCKLSRVIPQPIVHFWYSSEHRMILVASYAKQNSTSQSKTPLKEILLMDGYFFKVEKSPVPLLELPPPDKMPRFELGPGVSGDSIHIVSIYGKLLILVQFTSQDEDYCSVYQLGKQNVDKIFTLAFGYKVGTLSISTCDNIILCHDLDNKKTSLFDIYKTPLERVSPSASQTIDALVSPSPVFMDHVETENPSIDSNFQVDNPFYDLNFVGYDEIGATVIQNLKQIPIKSSLVIHSNNHLLSPDEFLYSKQYEIHSNTNKLYFREKKIIYHITLDIYQLAQEINSPIEKALFLSRRGRKYLLRHLQDESLSHVKLSDYESRLSKSVLLRLLYEYLNDPTIEEYIVSEYLKGMTDPYLNEYHRLLYYKVGGKPYSSPKENELNLELATLFKVSLKCNDVQTAILQNSNTNNQDNNNNKSSIRRSSLADVFSKPNNKSRENLDLFENELTLDPLETQVTIHASIFSVSYFDKKMNDYIVREYPNKVPILPWEKQLDTLTNNNSSSIPEKVPLIMRRDEKGDMIITQVEMLQYIWMPLFQSPSTHYKQMLYYFSEYISLLADQGVDIIPSLSIIHLHFLFYMNEYSSLKNYLQSKLYTDDNLVALEILQLSNLCAQEHKNLLIKYPGLKHGNHESVSIKHQYSYYTSTQKMLMNIETTLQILKEQGEKMLWRLKEFPMVVKWYLANHMVVEAMNICRKRNGTWHPLIQPGRISAIEFFDAAVKCIQLNSNFEPKELRTRENLELLRTVYNFIVTWDSEVLVKMGNEKSLLASKIPFPDDLFDINTTYQIKVLYGY